MVPYNEQNKKKNAEIIERNTQVLAGLLAPKMKQITQDVCKAAKQIKVWWNVYE